MQIECHFLKTSYAWLDCNLIQNKTKTKKKKNKKKHKKTNKNRNQENYNMAKKHMDVSRKIYLILAVLFFVIVLIYYIFCYLFSEFHSCDVLEIFLSFLAFFFQVMEFSPVSQNNQTFLFKFLTNPRRSPLSFKRKLSPRIFTNPNKSTKFEVVYVLS